MQINISTHNLPPALQSISAPPPSVTFEVAPRASAASLGMAPLKRYSPPAKSQAAFSVVEVLVASALLGFVFVSVLSGFSFGFRLLQIARENLRATQIAQEKMETLRLYSWEQINTSGFIPASFQASLNATNQNAGMLYYGKLSITNAPLTEGYSTNLRQAVVELSWNSGGMQHQRKMTTYISRYGLQNYIY